MTLPYSVQEIAEVIGRDAALYLIGKLPRCRPDDGKAGDRVILYVPKSLKPDHPLIAILGHERAQMLVEGFGGETLCPPTCQSIVRRFRDAEIRRLANDNVGPADIADMMGMTARMIRNITRKDTPVRVADNDNQEIPQED